MKIIKTAQFEKQEKKQKLPNNILAKIQDSLRRIVVPQWQRDLPRSQILEALQQYNVDLDDFDLQKYWEYMKLPGDMYQEWMETDGSKNSFDLIMRTPQGEIPLRHILRITWWARQSEANRGSIVFETMCQIV